jgi:phage terminase small subunit
LIPKKLLFVEEYLVDLNATQAAIRAGYSEKTAYSQGQRLLKNVEVAAAIEAAQGDRSERTEITQDMVVKGLLTEARFMGSGTSHGARVRAWAHLGKHLCIFTEKIQVERMSISAEPMSEEEWFETYGHDPDIEVSSNPN